MSSVLLFPHNNGRRGRWPANRTRHGSQARDPRQTGGSPIFRATAPFGGALHVTCRPAAFITFRPYLVALSTTTVGPPPAAEAGRTCDIPAHRHLCGARGLRRRPTRAAPDPHPAVESGGPGPRRRG